MPHQPSSGGRTGVLDGFPGADKLTILKHAKELLPFNKTRLLDNHLSSTLCKQSALTRIRVWATQQSRGHNWFDAEQLVWLWMNCLQSQTYVHYNSELTVEISDLDMLNSHCKSMLLLIYLSMVVFAGRFRGHRRKMFYIQLNTVL